MISAAVEALAHAKLAGAENLSRGGWRLHTHGSFRGDINIPPIIGAEFPQSALRRLVSGQRNDLGTLALYCLASL